MSARSASALDLEISRNAEHTHRMENFRAAVLADDPCPVAPRSRPDVASGPHRAKATLTVRLACAAGIPHKRQASSQPRSTHHTQHHDTAAFFCTTRPHPFRLGTRWMGWKLGDETGWREGGYKRSDLPRHTHSHTHAHSRHTELFSHRLMCSSLVLQCHHMRIGPAFRTRQGTRNTHSPRLGVPQPRNANWPA